MTIEDAGDFARTYVSLTHPLEKITGAEVLLGDPADRWTVFVATSRCTYRVVLQDRPVFPQVLGMYTEKEFVNCTGIPTEWVGTTTEN